ncbi:MAG TPA: 4Fe-4S binding protein [Nitrospirota bacterium]
MQYRVSENVCTGCGTCLDVCPTEAIKLQDGRAVITIDCIDCGACPRVCPEGAIKQVLSTTVQNLR